MFVGYARPSTRDQSPGAQLSALKAAGCATVFVEKVSGAQRDRPELKAALQTIRSGDTLVVWKLDRLARSVRQLAETLADLQQRHVGLKVLTQQLDTDAADGELIFRVFETVAEFERELTLGPVENQGIPLTTAFVIQAPKGVWHGSLQSYGRSVGEDAALLSWQAD